MRTVFYTCDVFTDSRFGGNPLAVLPDATGLTTAQMQLIAREFNYSETTFVLPAGQKNARKVRIFTPQEELPFAGHPNIGTAFVLAYSGELGDFGAETEIIFEEKAGPVPMTIRRESGGRFWCELRAPALLELGTAVAPERMAAILSLTPTDIEVAIHPPLEASVGLAFVIVELKSRQALENAAANLDALRDLAPEVVNPAVYLYIRSQDDFDIRGRMYAPLNGIPEDPATGSANCALAGLLAHHRPEAAGRFRWRIAQGVEMNRPSVLEARAEKKEGAVTGVWIAGNSVMVSRGEIEVE